MFVRLTNTPRPYAWGSPTAIAGLLGREPSGGPEAELWLGAHAGSPSTIVDPDAVGGARDLAEWIRRDPGTALGSPAADGEARLPFLLKILAAAEPLSLQAHPSPERAAAGFAREDALGIPLDASHRNYKDAYHKPELIYALSDTFEALCGFRLVDEVRGILAELAAGADPDTAVALRAFGERLAVDPLGAEAALRSVVEWLLTGGEGVGPLLEAVVDTARRIDDASLSASAAAAAGTVRLLAEAYPGDPGIVLSLLLNRVTLRAGEALYLPAGNIHAYLNGLGVELMAASDNVLRGGLTPKHVDVPELVEVLEFAPLPVPYVTPERPAPGVEVFRPDVPDFALYRIHPEEAAAGLDVPGPAIAICTEGDLTVAGPSAECSLDRGEAVYVTPDETPLTITGTGTLFLATTNDPASCG